MAAARNIAAVAVATAVVLAGGGWALAKRYASQQARDAIGSILVRYRLSDTVSYDDISASPFGTVTIWGPAVAISPNIYTRAAVLDLTEIQRKDDEIRRVRVSARGIAVPVLAMARTQQGSPLFQYAAKLGYTMINGDASILVDFDDQRQSFILETEGDARDAASWRVAIKIGGIDRDLLPLAQVLSGWQMPNSLAERMMMVDVAMKSLDKLTRIVLEHVEVKIDNTGLSRRQRELVDSDVALDRPEERAAVPPLDEDALIRAGVSQATARDAVTAVRNWVDNGGTLRVVTRLDRPLPLFRNSSVLGELRLAFPTPEKFLAVTRATISN